ncbi:CU044_5270 family protein [Nocardioides zeae]
MAVIVAVTVTVVDVPGTPTPAAYAATPALLEVRAPQEVDYPLAGTDPTAALERLAAAAARQPGAGTGDTQVVTRVGWWLDEDADRPGQRRVVPTRSEVRQLPDGTTRIVVRRGEPLRVGETTVDPGDGPVDSDEVFPRDPVSPLDHPDRLPTDPAALAAALLGAEDACVGFRAYCLGEMIGTLNLDHVPSPALEAGLIRTLVGNDDITYAGTTRDRLGRDVDVFAVEDPDDQRQYLLMFDPRTGYFVGRETVLLVAQPDLEDVAPPAVVEFDAVVDRVSAP